MTDKEKIRKEVERMHNLLPIMDGDNISINYADRICRTLEMYIDSLQEEPVSEDLEEASLRASIIRGQYIPKEHLHEYPYNAYAQSMFKRGAKWQKVQLIDKACSFLHHYQEYPNHDIATDKLVEAFRMYIEL